MQDISFTEDGLVLPPTPLRDVPAIAKRAGVARVLVKLECERPLGNFKVLGGMYAGLRMLADHAGVAIPDLVEARGNFAKLPRLICASDGNHGLSVAAAANAAGSAATIYLHEGVPRNRASRIENLGGSIAWVEGTYDDAVDEAVAAAHRGDGLLIPDTTSELQSAAVELVMQGYATITRELSAQFADLDARLTHSFVQAGVGGLAAAIADGLKAGGHGGSIIVVEPRSAPCVGRALAGGKLERVEGDLVTTAEMLSCGLASAPALEILQRHGAQAVEVTEAQLAHAVHIFRNDTGIETTASGATGLAGLLHVAKDPELRRAHDLNAQSTILLIVTEGAQSME